MKLPQKTAKFGLILALWWLTACAAPASPPTATPQPTPAPVASVPATFTNPVFDQDFPDPDVLRVEGAYYAYATNAYSSNIQVARSTDLVHWTRLPDALPRLPAWAAPEFGWAWAPEVFRPEPDGPFVMFFVARYAIGAGGTQCIGLAVSNSPEGPFVSSAADPFLCQVGEGGSIDPGTFLDDDGQRYLLWKNDGNSGGGQTWLYIQPLSADGLTLQGEPTRLLTADQVWEGILVEAPTLWKQEGRYFLFYSANLYNDQRYAVGYAVADAILGPYSKAAEPLLKTSIPAGLVGPGGQDLTLGPRGDAWILFHGWAPGSYRRLYLAPLTWVEGAPGVGLDGKNPLPIP